MTHEELLQEINERLGKCDCSSCNYEYAGFIALRAVVELHKPNEFGDCIGCDNRCGCYQGDIMDYNKWETCPTIQAIEKELANES
jgi:hypothetical protein